MTGLKAAFLILYNWSNVSKPIGIYTKVAQQHGAKWERPCLVFVVKAEYLPGISSH